MNVTFLNYSDDRHNHKGGNFRKWQVICNESAERAGIANIVSWQHGDLKRLSEYARHQKYFDASRFDNGAVWKPFIVLDQLGKMNEGDVLFYHDCVPWGIRRSVSPLLRLVEKNGRFFQKTTALNGHWTKRDAFYYMGCDTPRYHYAMARQNTWFFIKKDKVNVQFVQEWATYNLDERIASYRKPNTCGKPNIFGFKENRGDQSIFSNLAIKYNDRSPYISSQKNINLFIDVLNTPPVIRALYKAGLKVQLRLKIKDYCEN